MDEPIGFVSKQAAVEFCIAATKDKLAADLDRMIYRENEKYSWEEVQAVRARLTFLTRNFA